MTLSQPPGNDHPAPRQRESHATWSFLAIALNFMVIWVLNAELVPGINESHYLTKAKHLWNPGFAPGDLFLSSGNAHWLFAQLAGWMSTWLSLTATAWIGRVVCWLAMAWAWYCCARQLKLMPIHAACVLAGWLLATRYGNWAGEWAVGGFESKAIAYPLIIWAIAEMLRGAWSRVWILCGAAVAFHPLVGGWAGLTLFFGWCWWGRDASRSLSKQLTEQALPLLIASAISMIGIVPALAMIGGPAKQGEIVVAQIHAYYRLSHHQTPHLFWMSQHVAGAATLALTLLATLTLLAINKRFGATEDLQPTWQLMQLAWLALAFNAVGLIIDLIGVRIRPDIAASLLRFYWFRWADIVVPLAWVSSLWSILLFLQRSPAVRQSAGWHVGGWVLGIVCLLSLVSAVWQRVDQQLSTSVAPADRTLLMTESTQLASGPEVVHEWLAVCDWIRQKTPEDSLFLTPRAQQTFKWYAERAEVVTFKDVPQDTAALLEWYDRVGRCAPPRDAELQPLGWKTPHLLRLQKRYGFQYLLVDRRIQRESPLLQLVYPPLPPQSIVSGTYAVFKMPLLPSE